MAHGEQWKICKRKKVAQSISNFSADRFVDLNLNNTRHLQLIKLNLIHGINKKMK